MGYQQNEYDWCVMKNIINDKQYTTIWHVNDLKTSHVYPSVIYIVLAEITEEYEKIEKMSIKRVKVHKYLGMTIDYSLPGKVILPMIDYIGNMLDDIPEVIKRGSSTPAAHHLFKILEDTTKLSQTDADIVTIFSTTTRSLK